MICPTPSTLIAALSAIAGEHSTPEAQTAFSRLSEEAQDAIIWALFAKDGETPPAMSDAVKDEICQWAMEPDDLQAN